MEFSCTGPFPPPGKHPCRQLTCNEINTISHSSSQSCAIDDIVTTVVIKVVTRPICNKSEGIYRLWTVVIIKIGCGGKWREKTFACNKRSEKSSVKTHRERGWAPDLFYRYWGWGGDSGWDTGGIEVTGQDQAPSGPPPASLSRGSTQGSEQSSQNEDMTSMVKVKSSNHREVPRK